MSFSIDFKQRRTSRNVTIITDDIINRISKTRMFDMDADKNNRLYELHRYLLRYSMSKNESCEVGILWNIISDEYIVIKGTENGISLRGDSKANNWLEYSYKNSLVFLHNHPRNSIFSFMDLQSFCDYETIVAMTAVCNDGRIHMMRKETDFNSGAVNLMYSNALNHSKSGINEIIKNASKLGLLYRCSVSHRRER